VVGEGSDAAVQRSQELANIETAAARTECTGLCRSRLARCTSFVGAPW
jgi:hypothetical protein